MVLLLGSLSFVGYDAGKGWLYDYVVEDSIHYLYLYDTLLSVGAWDGSGSRCTFSPSVDRALMVFSDYPMSYLPDSAFAYYDGTYLVDLVGVATYSPFYGAGIRTLKFPITVGDTWQAIDTCIYALGQKVPHPQGSIDEDTLVDTLWYDTSYASLESYTGDTITVAFAPINMVEKLTALQVWDDTTYLCCRTYYHQLYGKVIYIAGMGMYGLRIDSAVVDIAYGLINTNTWDTTFVPRTYLQTVYSPLRWDYVSTDVAERPSKEGYPAVDVYGRTLKVRRDALVYAADGRLLFRLGPGASVSLQPGVYFVKTPAGVRKVVIR